MTDLERLEGEGRIEEAAELAERQGKVARASELFERACLFERAARCALQASDPRRAFLLASLAADQALLDSCVEALVQVPAQAQATAQMLCARGQQRWAAQLLERLGDCSAAAEAWAAAGEPSFAARAYEASGDLRGAARVLESAVRAEPEREDLMFALGSLLVRAERHEAAIRLLQRIGPQSPFRPQALPLLARCFEMLGLTGPLEALQEEAQREGLSLQPKEPTCAAPAPQGVLYGRYEVIRVAASTQGARVLEAQDRLSNKRVAVKQLLGTSLLGAGRDAFGRLVREARILQQLRHSNVVPLVELVEEAGVIVTPWMQGGSLAELVAREPIAPARAAEIACAVLGALAEAHRLGILHRDVKPSNVLFDSAGVAYLADFGAAHISDSSATATAGVIGTLAYMSPEQRAGLPATAASDIFGVGALLLEMLTGQPPPIGAEPPVAPSGVHVELTEAQDRILLSLIAERPSDRPASALAARAALDGIRWPATLPKRRLQPSPRVSSRPPAKGRLQESGQGLFEDLWLQRKVLVLPCTEATLRLAGLWAAAACDALCGVLRVDAEAQQIWFEQPQGQSLAESRGRLTRAQLLEVESALQRLHCLGAAHGAVDATQVFIVNETVQLGFSLEGATRGTIEQDLKMLQALGEWVLD